MAFQVYALTPGGYRGPWGNQARFNKQPVTVSLRDVFDANATADYVVAVMPATARLPKRIDDLLAACAATSAR